METSPPPRPAVDLATQQYYHLVYTLTDLLPPPLDDTPEALQARNHAAIAKVAALLPVNANEIDLAAQCIAARAQAEAMLRLIRQNAGDIGLVMRLNAQYGSMVRTSLSVLGRLMRVQAVRQKREAIEGAASQDAWTLHVAERSMLQVTDPDAEPPQAPVPEAAPAAGLDPRIEENAPENGTDSQDVAFETLMSEQLLNLGSIGSGETGLHAAMHEAIARSLLAGSRSRGRELSTNGRESPGMADQSGASAECPDRAQSGSSNRTHYARLARLPTRPAAPSQRPTDEPAPVSISQPACRSSGRNVTAAATGSFPDSKRQSSPAECRALSL